MKCPICRCGETIPGYATTTLERDGMTLFVKHVPADVCENCGEEFIREEAAASLLHTAEAAAHSGVQVELRQFATA